MFLLTHTFAFGDSLWPSVGIIAYGSFGFLSSIVSIFRESMFWNKTSAKAEFINRLWDETISTFRWEKETKRISCLLMPNGVGGFFSYRGLFRFWGDTLSPGSVSFQRILCLLGVLLLQGVFRFLGSMSIFEELRSTLFLGAYFLSLYSVFPGKYSIPPGGGMIRLSYLRDIRS